MTDPLLRYLPGTDRVSCAFRRGLLPVIRAETVLSLADEDVGEILRNVNERRSREWNHGQFDWDDLLILAIAFDNYAFALELVAKRASSAACTLRSLTEDLIADEKLERARRNADSRTCEAATVEGNLSSISA